MSTSTAIRFAGIDCIVFAARQTSVPRRYFACPYLKIEDFKKGDFDYFGGVDEDRVLHLSENGDE